jgi:hypothetical protein
MTKRNVQLIDPRDAGLRALDLKHPIFGDDALARADKTLEALGGAMEQWLDADIARLQEARLNAECAGWDDASLEPLMTAADIKGMGTTYGYPLATQIGASLCRLIETAAGKAAARREPALVCAHVDALRALVRDDVRTDAHPVGQALLQALDARVAALGVAPR